MAERDPQYYRDLYLENPDLHAYVSPIGRRNAIIAVKKKVLRRKPWIEPMLQKLTILLAKVELKPKPIKRSKKKRYLDPRQNDLFL